MKKRSSIMGLVASLFLLGCGAPAVFQTKDDQMLVQVSRLKQERDQPPTYKARLTIISPALFDQGRQNGSDLLYHADSSFYFLKAGKKLYPAYVQPVANGVANTFEYMIGSANNMPPEDTVTLIYQDKFINHRVYNVLISN